MKLSPSTHAVAYRIAKKENFKRGLLVPLKGLVNLKPKLTFHLIFLLSLSQVIMIILATLFLYNYKYNYVKIAG